MLKGSSSNSNSNNKCGDNFCSCDIWGGVGGVGGVGGDKVRISSSRTMANSGSGCGAAVIVNNNDGPSTSSHHQHNQHQHLQQQQNNSDLLLSSSSSSIPMEFIQVLIHQHAKTLVALQSLEKEVKTLKTSSSKPSFPTTLTTPTGTTTPLQIQQQPHPLSSSSVLNNQITTTITRSDSGFTDRYYNDRKSSSISSSDDELYSLLSLIQCKVERNLNNKINKSYGRENLGALDELLGNSNFEFGNKMMGKIDKSVLRGILNCPDLVELKRQLLFEVAKRGHLHQQLEEMKNNSPSVIITNCNNNSNNKINNKSSQTSRVANNSSGSGSIVGATAVATTTPTPNNISPVLNKSLNSFPSSSNSNFKSFIPVPIARIKKKSNVEKDNNISCNSTSNNNNNNKKKFLWAQWFSSGGGGGGSNSGSGGATTAAAALGS